MRKTAASLALAALLALAGCAQITTAWDAATSAKVPPKVVIVAANAFDAVEGTVTGYIRFCAPNPSPAGCSDDAIRQIIPAVRSGRDARDQLEQFLAAHPDQLGPKGLYDTLTAATATLQQIVAEYSIGGSK